MGTKTVYICDNTACEKEEFNPEKWFSISSSHNSIRVVSFNTGLRDTKSFCGMSCALKFLSSELPKLHKAEIRPKEALSPASLEQNKPTECTCGYDPRSNERDHSMECKVHNSLENKVDNSKLKEFLYGK